MTRFSNLITVTAMCPDEPSDPPRPGSPEEPPSRALRWGRGPIVAPVPDDEPESEKDVIDLTESGRWGRDPAEAAAEADAADGAKRRWGTRQRRRTRSE